MKNNVNNRLFSQGRKHFRSVGKSIALIGVVFLLPSSTRAQVIEYATPDAVVSFVPGEGGGRGSDYMPGNVFGLPDTIGRTTVPTVDPAQVLSLGLGGEIILRFDRTSIVDGPGVDFTVFENVFEYRLGGKDKIYAEPAEIAVSRDGVEYVSFPYDSLTLQGCAGVTPTNGDKPPDDPSVSGGDGFDLAQIGMDSIRFVRIRDVTRIVKNNPEHPFYDVTLNGFDLDALVGVHVVSSITTTGVRETVASGDVLLNVPSVLHASSFAPILDLPRPAFVQVRLVDAIGREGIDAISVQAAEGKSQLEIPASGLPTGTYFLVVKAEGIGLFTRTIRIVR